MTYKVNEISITVAHEVAAEDKVVDILNFVLGLSLMALNEALENCIVVIAIIVVLGGDSIEPNRAVVNVENSFIQEEDLARGELRL